jgi:arylsulfatase
MAEERSDVLVAGYPSVEAANADFDALIAAVKAKAARIEAAILVSKDAAGNVVVEQTGDNLGRKGLGYGGGVGFLVGLAAPPLLAATVVGAAAGGLMGRFANKRLETGIHDKIGEALPPGRAAIIATYDEDQNLAVQQVLHQALARSVVQTDKSGVGALKGSLAEAMGKFAQDRSVLPIPDRAFGGAIGRTMDASVGDWSMIPGPKAPDGAPNVLVILVDDAGFGGPETFGGEIRTPALTRVQQTGLTYNRFHVTAVCSPTRAALLTGRNHHRVGMGGIAEFPGPFPGYTGTRPRSCTALPRILKENGYITGGFGKWHMTPGREMGPAGPFEHWPQAWGFDHWWGFLTGAAGQYDPVITHDNSVVGVPEGRDGKLYYFPDDITDKSIEWLHAVRAHDAHKPWFVYYSTGATHAPHHVAKEWADKYKGKFDDGWDAYRVRTLERQKRLGIVPPDTDLAPRPDPYPAWDTLGAAEKKLYARQMEVFAGFSENTDWNVGRLLDAIEEMGELDNTLILYIWGDNGASMEGTITGSFNETTFFNGLVLDAEQQLALIEKFGGLEGLGGFHSAPHFAAAWAHAQNTPFRWGKQMASHLGGARDPMVVAWPNRIKPAATCAPSSPTASTSRPRSWTWSASLRRRWWTGSSRSRWTARPSPTPSTTRPRPSGTPSSTSRCTAAAPSARTAGGPAPGWTSCRGTSPPPPWPASSPAAGTTRTRTPGSSTTCRTTSRRPTTSRPSGRRSWPSCASSSGRRPRATGPCRSSAAWPSSSASCPRCRRTPGTSSPATSRTSRRP